MTRRARRSMRHVDGVLLLDKPRGISSQTAVTRARYALEAVKAGHTGTLDPMADGLLPLCFGEATKFSQFALDADKAYRANIRLGITTSTGDAEGEITGGSPGSVGREDIECVLPKFVGVIQQTPPMYSAIRKDGRRLYELAREGISVERAARHVRIQKIDLLSLQGDVLEIEVACSKGTYIRVLAEDIGSALGCGAHLTALTRTRVGRFRLDDAISLDELCAMGAASAPRVLRPVDSLVSDLPEVLLEAPSAVSFKLGQAIPASSFGDQAGLVRVYSSGVFLGVGELNGGGSIKPRRLLSQMREGPVT